MPESTARCKIMVGRVVVQFGFQRNIIVGIIPSAAVLQAKRGSRLHRHLLSIPNCTTTVERRTLSGKPERNHVRCSAED